MSENIETVKCPDCGHEQSDMGRGTKCEECGSEMPFYDEDGNEVTR